jgi:ERCC4-type nuclease
MLDNREGSWPFAKLEPVRSLLAVCPECQGIPPHPTRSPNGCPGCHQWDRSLNGGRGGYVSVGRKLSRITTADSEGGPDALVVGNGPGNRSLLIAVELKDIRDLLSSARTGRLQSATEGQLPAMLADYDQSWLCWYGAIRWGEDGNLEAPVGKGPGGQCMWGPFTHNGSRDGKAITNDYLDGLLLAVAAMGVLVHRVHNERQAARWLGALHRYWTKGWDEHGFTRTFNQAPRFPQTVTIEGLGAEESRRVLARARRVFDRYPGLGMERALAAAQHFGSVREMANASEKDWMKVPGIGKVLAPQIVKGFNE